MGPFALSLVIWYGGWIGLYFGFFEGLALFWHKLDLPGDCPWYTLSRTSWQVMHLALPIELIYLIGLALLLVHIVAGGPIKLVVKTWSAVRPTPAPPPDAEDQ